MKKKKRRITKPKGGVSASSTAKAIWKSINWTVIEKQVYRLQVRIAKAVKENRWSKVRTLQRILVTSRAAKLLAVKTITTSKGKNTPGVDGVVWRTANAKLKAVEALKRRGYKASPLRRKLIPKPNGKKRKLGIPTMKDRAFQALYNLALAPVAETTGDPHSYGFRKHRSVADAISQCRVSLAQKNRATWILEGDIKACFDQIDHQWMLDHIPMDKFVLKQWLTAGFFEKDRWYPTDQGTPQGGPVSPTLANMVLDGLQGHIRRSVPANAKVNFIRFADDFIVTGVDRGVLEGKVKPAIENFLAPRGLTLSKAKTKIVRISEGFDFLGHNIRKYKGALRVKPSKGKTKAFAARLRCLVKEKLPNVPPADLIPVINRKVRGWTNFYRGCCSSKIFKKVDYWLFDAIWRKLRRIHPNKSKKWIKRKYYSSRGSFNWILFGVKKKGTLRKVFFLFPATSCRFRQHTKLRANTNPFLPEYGEYLQKRMAKQSLLRRADWTRSFSTSTGWIDIPKPRRSS